MDTHKNNYNGWKNYETWCISLWIDNEREMVEEAREIARSGEEIWDSAEMLKEWINEMNPLNDSDSVWSDLLSGALSEIDWYEIAEYYRSEE